MAASGALVAKLGALTLAVALTAGALLAVRQRRILAANALIETHRRIVLHERALRQIRADIGQMIAPARVEQLAARLGPMRPAGPLTPRQRSFDAVPRRLIADTSALPPAPPAVIRPQSHPPAGPLTYHPESANPRSEPR